MEDTRKNRIKKIIYVLVLIVIIFSNIYKNINTRKEYLTYDEVVTYVKEGEISKIEAEKNSSQISITMKDGGENKAIIPSLDEFSSFISKEIEEGVDIKFEIKENLNLLEIIPDLLSIVLTVVLIIMLSKRFNTNDIKSTDSETTFADVAGIDEEKEQLMEIVEFLRNPQKYTSMGAKIPKGILLNGEPGTGKTLLAKAIAGEAEVPFFQVNGSSFEEMFVGVGASRVRKLFKTAKEQAPCIIFIDELDSVAKSRYTGKTYSEQTLNQLLAEMDGFKSRDNIIVIAATNHIEVLDPAIIRPGRFDRHVYIPRPDVNAREEILQIHAKNKTFADEVSLKEIAKKTVGFSGADLENILNEAAIYAVNQEKSYITKSDIDEAIARVLIGLEKKKTAITDDEKWLTAVHEAGHAIVSTVVRPEVKNFGISIIPRGSAGGYNFFDESNKSYKQKQDMQKEIQVGYGGRVAEEIFLKDISTGASNDLEVASKIAYDMVTKFAMGDSLLVKIGNETNYNDKLDKSIMEEAEKICKDAYQKAHDVIELHKEQVEMLANLLYEKEYLSQNEVNDFMKKIFK